MIARIDENILRLNISMANIDAMNVRERSHHLVRVVLQKNVREIPLVLFIVVANHFEKGFRHEVHHQVQIDFVRLLSHHHHTCINQIDRIQWINMGGVLCQWTHCFWKRIAGNEYYYVWGRKYVVALRVVVVAQLDHVRMWSDFLHHLQFTVLVSLVLEHFLHSYNFACLFQCCLFAKFHYTSHFLRWSDWFCHVV